MKIIVRKRPRFGSSTHFGPNPAGAVVEYRRRWFGWFGLQRRRVVPNSVYIGEGDERTITGEADMLLVNGGKASLGEGAIVRNVTIIKGDIRFPRGSGRYEFAPGTTIEKLHVLRGFAGTIPPATPTHPEAADNTRTEAS